MLIYELPEFFFLFLHKGITNYFLEKGIVKMICIYSCILFVEHIYYCIIMWMGNVHISEVSFTVK